MSIFEIKENHLPVPDIDYHGHVTGSHGKLLDDHEARLLDLSSSQLTQDTLIAELVSRVSALENPPPPPPSVGAVLVGWLPEGKGSQGTIVEQDVIDTGPEVYDEVTSGNVHRYNCPFDYNPNVAEHVEMHPYCWIPKDIAPEWKGTSYWSGFIDTWPKWDFTIDSIEGTLAVNNLRSEHGPMDYYIDYPEGVKYGR